MGGSYYRSGNSSGFQYEKRSYNPNDKLSISETEKRKKERDNDLIIEDNTIYEVDRDCYERLKRQKKGNKMNQTGL
jgi:hypothetical protein